jgi:methyl-accepting chemotaxis protein
LSTIIFAWAWPCSCRLAELDTIKRRTSIRWSIGNKIVAVFVVAIVIYGIVTGLTYRGIRQHDETTARENHTYEVLINLDRVLSALMDAETGQRGFVITGAEQYLEPYRRGKADVRKALERVRELTADNPVQRKHIANLDPLAMTKLSELEETIDLRRTKGFEAALAVVRTNKGKTVMDQVRVVIGEMRDEEQRLLAERREGVRSSDARNVRVVDGAGPGGGRLLADAHDCVAAERRGERGQPDRRGRRLRGGRG